MCEEYAVREDDISMKLTGKVEGIRATGARRIKDFHVFLRSGCSCAWQHSNIDGNTVIDGSMLIIMVCNLASYIFALRFPRDQY